MKTLVLATRNSDKVSEIEQAFGDLDITIQTFRELRDFPFVKEDGKSLNENAVKKAKVISSFSGKLSLADDSGLEVEALNNRPGVLSSRFSGKNATYEQNNRKLLSLLSGIPARERTARFKCVMVLSFPSGRIENFEGRLKGEILMKARGENGFGYDPIFFIPELGKTLAELTLEQKNRISHRGKVLKKVHFFLSKYISSVDC